MELLNNIIGLPGMVNDKLPANHWNSTIENSEDSMNAWIGKLLHILAFAFVVKSVIGIFKEGFGSFENSEAMYVVGSIVTMLLCIYVAFPLTQFIRSAGDSLASSNSGIIEFLLKDLVIALLKLGGYAAALIALLAALAQAVSFVLDSPVFFYDFEGFSVFGYGMMAGILYPFAEFLEMARGLEDLTEGGYYSSRIGYKGLGWTQAGATAVIMNFIKPLATLIMLYVSIATYKFFYALASRFLSWVQNPAFPIKMV